MNLRISNWSGTLDHRGSWVWGASTWSEWGSNSLLISKGTLIYPEDKRHLCFHCVVTRYYLDLPTYKEMKGSCTLSLAFCYVRNFKYLITLRENEDSNLEGSFHITVFPLMNLMNMQSNVIRCSGCLPWEQYSTWPQQLSTFDPLCEKSIANWYYEILKCSMKYLNPPIFAISEQQPIHTPIRRISQFVFSLLLKNKQNVIFYSHKIMLVFHLDGEKVLHVIHSKPFFIIIVIFSLAAEPKNQLLVQSWMTVEKAVSNLVSVKAVAMSSKILWLTRKPVAFGIIWQLFFFRFFFFCFFPVFLNREVSYYHLHTAIPLSSTLAENPLV